MAVEKLNEAREILVPDLGVTLRTLLGVATQGYKEIGQRRWSLRYKGALIGSLQVKDAHLKPLIGKRNATKPKQPSTAELNAGSSCKGQPSSAACAEESKTPGAGMELRV